MRIRGAMLVLLACVPGLPALAGAQRPVPRAPTPVRREAMAPRTPGDTTRVRPDTVIAADTAAKANLVAPDSTMARLLALPGYDSKVYQGEKITFDAQTRGICLTDRGTIASGDSLLIKSQSICSSGTGNQIRVGSDSGKGRNVIGLPGQRPIFSTGASTYDVGARRAVVNRVSTSLDQSGELLQIAGDRIVVVDAPRDSLAKPDSTDTAASRRTFYVRDGTITACTDSVPDYYFKAGEIKRTGSFVVARPAVLYIGDVPVLWLPFLFQDVRGGRHSGILAPNIGVSDIVRNNPSYRRTIEGLGYYVAISDYLDAQAYLDWRSSAGESEFSGDAGYVRYTGEMQYKWIERYVSGRLAVSQTAQAGQSLRNISLDHSQEFSRNASLHASLNYSSNTFLQRQTTTNPFQVSSTIRSSANYAHKAGPFAFTLGLAQTQYPGRTQVERDFPSFNMSSSPLDLGSWLVWTPSLTYASHQSLNIDQPTNLGLFLQPGRATGDTIPGDTLRRNSYTSNLSFGTPVQIFGYTIGNQFTINSERNDFPQVEIVTGVVNGVQTPRIYASTYRTTLDWTPSFTLPPLGRNNFNLSPSLSFQNVDPSAFAIRNHRTNGAWVHQSKRPTLGLSASPALFGLYGGFGPYSRIRHSVTPVLSYSYAPRSEVSNEFLAAQARTKFNTTTGDTTGYLGSLAQNALTFQLSTLFEAKSRSANDSTPEAGQKVKLLSVNFSGLSYDFERARATKKAIRGLTTEAFNYTLRSDLLPGFDVGVNYSLFEGSTLSDSARFRPYREGVTANFSFSKSANPFAVFARLFGKAVPETREPVTSPSNPQPDERYARQVASQPVAGRASSRGAFLPTTTQGWQASFQFTSQRRRPVSGANVVAFDPTIRCRQEFPAGPRFQLAYEQCVAQANLNPAAVAEKSIGSGLPGATIFTYPNTTSLGTNVNFNLTERWSAAYNTNYDFELRSFATQVVSLQRDLHDWRAIFGFTQAANGAFSFNFLVSLKAEPELKFDYHKSTYRGASF